MPQTLYKIILKYYFEKHIISNTKIYITQYYKKLTKILIKLFQNSNFAWWRQKKKKKVWQNYFEILSHIQPLRSRLYQHEKIFGDEYRSINNKKHSACGYFGQDARCTWCRRFTPYFFQTHPYHPYTRTHTSPEIH